MTALDDSPSTSDGSVAVSIAEAAEATGVSVDTLRYYERVGLTPTIQRTEGGQRAYSPDDLGWISFVRRLRATGMPVREIVTYADMVRSGDGTVAERRRFLEAHRERVAEAITELERALTALDHKIAHYEAVEAGEETDCADAPLEQVPNLS